MIAGLILIAVVGAPSSPKIADVPAKQRDPRVQRESHSASILKGNQLLDSGLEPGQQLPLTQLPVVVVSKDCPTREESAVVALWEDGRVSMTVTGDAGVPRSFDICKGVKELLGRVFDMAYEQKSGDAVIACYDQENKKIFCRIFDGINVNKLASLAMPVAMRVGYMAMRARPNSDEIVLMVSGVASDGKMQLHSNEWNGDKWKGWQVVSGDLERDQSRQPAAEWSSPPQKKGPDTPRK